LTRCFFFKRKRRHWQGVREI